MADHIDYSDYTIEQPEVDETLSFKLDDGLTQNDIWEAEASEKRSQGADKEPIVNQQKEDAQKSTQEAVHNFVNRPALAIDTDHSFVCTFAHAKLLASLLDDQYSKLTSALKSVGRIVTPFVENNVKKLSVGTGWLIGDDIIVTNQHVAKRFAHTEAPYAMRDGVHPTINFHPNGKEEGYSARIIECLYMFRQGCIDFALCRIEKRTGKLTELQPIECDPKAELNVNNPVSVIGYPAKPSEELYSEAVIKKIDLVFEKEYGVKKLAPGLIVKLCPKQIESVEEAIIAETGILHDCSTLGGNSGSVVIDAKTGKAVALHAGTITSTNYSVPIHYITDVYNNLVK